MQSAIRIAQRGAAAESPLAVRARRLSEQSLSPMLLRRDSGSMTAAVDAPLPKLSANRRGAIFPGSAAHEAVKVMVNGSPVPQRLSARRSAISPGSAAFEALTRVSAPATGAATAADAAASATASAQAALAAYESSCSVLGATSERASVGEESSC